jgi:hypothetical protein
MADQFRTMMGDVLAKPESAKLGSQSNCSILAAVELRKLSIVSAATAYTFVKNVIKSLAIPGCKCTGKRIYNRK